MTDTTPAVTLLRENGYKVHTGPDGFTATATVVALIACVTLDFKLHYRTSEDRIVMVGRRNDGESREVEWPLAEVMDAALMAVDTKFRAERS
jgi:hypothetical protein